MVRPAKDDGNTPRQTVPKSVSLGWSPFHAAAEDYYAAGFLPIPLPAGKKFPPPNGTPNDLDYTEEQLADWLAGRYVSKAGKERIDSGFKNIGAIVPDGVVVFDIDGPPGIESLAELESSMGALPKTWCSFRGDPQRYHLWFQCPAGLKWPGKLGAGLDVIYRHYRYMVCPPSIHPDGGQYRWANLRGDSLRVSGGYLPGIEEFSDLPDTWLTLADQGGYIYRERATVDSRMWLREHGRGKPCPEIRRVVRKHLVELRKHADLGGMHDALINAVWAIVAEIAQGHSGGYKALAKIRGTFFVQADASGRREAGAAEAEWERACVGAIEKTALEPVREGDPCIVEESERGSDPARFFDPKHGLKARSLRDAVELTGKLAVGPGKILYRHTEGLWVPDGGPEIFRRTQKLLGQRYRPGHAANVLSVVENRIPLITDDKQDTQFLNLPNGLLDWAEGKIYPHSSHVVSTVRIPIEWNDEAECPHIDQFFSEVFPGDAIELAYEILGYLLFNDNPLHKAILLHGTGRNGKGTFIRLARMLVGHNNISAITPQDLDTSNFTAAQLYGKLANLVGDVDPRIFKSTEKFKQLTGGDYITAQHKHKDPFVFRCRALMVAAFNSLPRTADTTEGFFSRWVVVPFTAFFPAGKADPTLIDRLTRTEELQGLLRYAVGGLQNVMRKGGFTIPASVEKATARFRDEADPMRSFITDCVRFTHEAFMPRTDLYQRYASWSVVNGFHAMSAQRFYEGFTTAAIDMASNVAIRSTTNANGVRGYRGIELR